MRTGRSSRAGRSEQVELHRDDGGPSEERDEEGGVVTLGASAGRCPGPATAAEVEPRLLRTNGACERAVCLRYGRLVTDLVDSRLLSLLTTRYGASRSHIRKAKRYLGCEKVHLCALTWVIPSRRAAGRRMRLRACLTSGLPAYLAGAGWPHCRSARASHGAHAPATGRPCHQNGCEAEPGTCWGMLRANHLVNRHEQGVRTMGRAAERQWNGWRRPDQGRTRKRCFSS